MNDLRLHGDTLVRRGMLDFAVNTWPERPLDLDADLARALDDVGRYPDQRTAREVVAACHGCGVDEVLLLNGACEGFWLLAHTLRPRHAVCVHPAFTEPEVALRAVGTRVERVLRDAGDWTFDPAEVGPDAEMVVIGHPNNPTGSLDDPDALSALAHDERILVVDESFMDFVPHGGASLAGRAAGRGIVVVRSLTKLWSLPGIRAGYLLGPADLVRRLEANRQPWSVSGPACAAITRCAADDAGRLRVAARVAAARAELLDGLRTLPGVCAWPSVTNFVLLRVADGAGLVRDLAEEGIAVRPAASFPGLDERYIRVAIRPPDDNRRLLAALADRCG